MKYTLIALAPKVNLYLLCQLKGNVLKLNRIAHNIASSENALKKPYLLGKSDCFEEI